MTTFFKLFLLHPTNLILCSCTTGLQKWWDSVSIRCRSRQDNRDSGSWELRCDALKTALIFYGFQQCYSAEVGHVSLPVVGFERKWLRVGWIKVRAKFSVRVGFSFLSLNRCPFFPQSNQFFSAGSHLNIVQIRWLHVQNHFCYRMLRWSMAGCTTSVQPQS